MVTLFSTKGCVWYQELEKMRKHENVTRYLVVCYIACSGKYCSMERTILTWIQKAISGLTKCYYPQFLKLWDGYQMRYYRKHKNISL